MQQPFFKRSYKLRLEFKYGKHIPHNTIHQILLEEGLANENTKKKKKRRKPWIRYEVRV